MKTLTRGFIIAFLSVSLSFGLSAQAPKSPQIVKAQGQTAFAFLPAPININATNYRINLFVIRDATTGNTMLSLRAITGSGGNRTLRFVTGTIPSSDFILAPDLTSASLITTISTSGSNFNNAEVGAFSLSISLSWSADLIGDSVDTFVFTERAIGSPKTSFRETFHSNGPHSDCTVTGTVGGATINSFASLDDNRTIDIVQSK